MRITSLLGQLVVAVTIEMDDVFETRLPHRTAWKRKAGEPGSGPWLTSYATWANFLRFAGPGGAPYDAVQRAGRSYDGGMRTLVAGMTRWGYVEVDKSSAVIRATADGVRAQQEWAPLPALVTDRWVERFGMRLDALRVGLHDALATVDTGDLPEYLPIATYPDGLVARLGDSDGESHPIEGADLVGGLAKLLLALTLEVERDAPLSLALSANLLRVLGEHGGEPVPVRDLPSLTGTSKEAVAYSLGLERHGLVKVDAGRPKTARLTDAGAAVLSACDQSADTVDRRQELPALRTALEAIVDDLLPGLVHPAQTWRAATKAPATLPHHPMVLHRGGYPDGA